MVSDVSRQQFHVHIILFKHARVYHLDSLDGRFVDVTKNCLETVLVLVTDCVVLVTDCAGS